MESDLELLDSLVTWSDSENPLQSEILTAASGSRDNVFAHMINFLGSHLKDVFAARGVASEPRSFAEFTHAHLAALADVMDTLHDLLGECKINKMVTLPISLASWNTLKPASRPDDEALEFMARALVKATGAIMPGQATHFSDSWDMHGRMFPASILTKDGPASSCQVMGPLQTQHFRRVESVVQSKEKKPPLQVEYDPDITEVKDGSPEPALEALKRLGRWMTTESVNGEPNAQSQPMKLLLLSTHAMHTTLVELSPQHPAQKAGTSPLPVHAATKWNCCVHDSLKAKGELDADLSKGLNTFLTEYWGKTGRFKHENSVPFVAQHDDVVCSFMALCRLILKLTGETLDATHWRACVGIIRCFFDLHLFLDAENRGAIEKGSIVFKLQQQASAFSCTLTHSKEDTFTNGKKRRKGGSCEKLRGIVHNLATDAGTLSFPFECQIEPVPKNGSCMLAAAARALARFGPAFSHGA